MTGEFMDRTTILNQLESIVVVQEKIAEYIHNRICQKSEELTEEVWETKRKEAFKHERSLIEKYAFSKKLPRNNVGIMTQEIISILLDIQHTYLRILVMIDMLYHDVFNEIFMDSMNTISSKVYEMMTALKTMINQKTSTTNEVENTLELIIKLERQIDEDNIVICRQISIATGGDSDFASYMMRKIVAELEHISDYVKECAEIISEI